MNKKAKINFYLYSLETYTCADTNNLEKQFNYKPVTSITDGVANFVKWYKDFIRYEKKDKNLKLAVIGLGYVGLPLALEFSKKKR